MKYGIRQITRDVRVTLDENRESRQLIEIGDRETLGLDELIASKVETAAGFVVLESPLSMMSGGYPLDGDIYWERGNSGRMLLPEDYLRLLVFKMSDWERAVHEAIGAESAEYRLQSSRCKGLRGNVQKPVVAVVRRGEGLELEFYSCLSDEAEIEQGAYMRVPRIDGEGNIEIPERCYKAVVEKAAALVYESIGELQRGQSKEEAGKGALI